MIPYPFRYGAEAGSDLEGRVRLYYKPRQMAGAEVSGAVRMALSAEVSSSDVSSVANYESVACSGLNQPSATSGPIDSLATIQAVPLLHSNKVRL